ncbi:MULTISPECIES: hypothetical protein [unclassified Streptomyces]|uniref:hypothetical protein n=1 Tax=unclassified Streptomyces TaxID=2593676 RepID=UPI000DB90F3C|nr:MULTISPECIES: hypothetical protein [unclassified Streptomyces]MYT68377.1 hypothetical protein [Streptomyces sp. SID8367]
MRWTQTELLVDSGAAIAATAAVASLWTLTVVLLSRVFTRALGEALQAQQVPSGKSGEVALLCVLSLASLAGPVLLIWLAWTHQLWLTAAAQLALPPCTLAWLRFTRRN